MIFIKCRRILIIVMLSILFSCCPGHAAQDIFYSFDRGPIVVGQSLIFHIAVRGGDPRTHPILEPIPGTEIQYIGSRMEASTTSSIVLSDGEANKSEKGGRTLYQFAVIPKKVGLLTIPTITFTFESNTYNTPAYRVKVMEAQEVAKNVFIEMEADCSTAYIGDRVVVTVRWFFNKDIAEGYHLRVPWLDQPEGYMVQDLAIDGDHKGFRKLLINDEQQILAERDQEERNGENYIVLVFRKILIPLWEGPLELSNIFLRCDVIKGYDGQQNRLLDDFFSNDTFGITGQSITKPLSTRSESLKLTVQSIPKDNVPESYQGAIGDLNFKASVEPQQVKLGDPVTMIMEISGTGNFPTIKKLDFPEVTSLSTKEPEVTNEFAEVKGRFRGRKIWRQVFVPTEKGDFEIPLVRFAFFDTTEGEYKEVVQGPFTIHSLLNEPDITSPIMKNTARGALLDTNQKVNEGSRGSKSMLMIASSIGVLIVLSVIGIVWKRRK